MTTWGSFIRLVDREREREDPRFYAVEFCHQLAGDNAVDLAGRMSVMLLKMPIVTRGDRERIGGLKYEIPRHVHDALMAQSAHWPDYGHGPFRGDLFRAIPIEVID